MDGKFIHESRINQKIRDMKKLVVSNNPPKNVVIKPTIRNENVQEKNLEKKEEERRTRTFEKIGKYGVSLEKIEQDRKRKGGRSRNTEENFVF